MAALVDGLGKKKRLVVTARALEPDFAGQYQLVVTLLAPKIET